jgi:4-amino-4-deoxy-L-arabinose transferase-like glycosyltransferase
MKKNTDIKTNSIKLFVRKHYVLLFCVALLVVGLYLRFWNIENTFEYGWDQARDAWKVRDILTGTLVLNGPRTGIGHFNLGPIWYYYLAPFYFLTRLDPIAAQYGNILLYVFNGIVFFWVTKKIFSDKFALLATYIFIISGYLIGIAQVPWNVSPVLGVSTLIFYCLHEIVIHSKYKLILLLMFLTGLFLHLHFAFVFLPPIIFFSLIFAKNKREVVHWILLGIPLFLIWVLPLLFLDIEWKGGNTNMFRNFLKDYFIDGFHFRFFLIRIHDAFIQYERVLSIPHSIMWGKFVIPILFVLVSLTERGKVLIRNYLMLLWFFIPAVVYSFYAGTTSEYYVLLNAPIAIYSVVYLVQKIFVIKRIPKILFVTIILLVLGFYSYRTSANQWIKPAYGGLSKQKDETRKCIKEGCKKEYDEGFIDSYLYSIWTDPKYKNYPFR